MYWSSTRKQLNIRSIKGSFEIIRWNRVDISFDLPFLLNTVPVGRKHYCYQAPPTWESSDSFDHEDWVTGDWLWDLLGSSSGWLWVSNNRGRDGGTQCNRESSVWVNRLSKYTAIVYIFGQSESSCPYKSLCPSIRCPPVIVSF